MCPSTMSRLTEKHSVIGVACAAISMILYMRLSNWQKAVDEAREREE